MEINRFTITTVMGQNGESQDRIEEVRNFNYASLADLSEDDTNKIIEELSSSTQCNEGSQKAVRRLVKNIKGLDRTTAEMIARTVLMTAYNNVALKRYRDAGVEKVEWVAASDELVCEICGQLDGKQWPLSEAPPCPAHSLCRCVLIAVPFELPDEEIEVD